MEATSKLVIWTDRLASTDPRHIDESDTLTNIEDVPKPAALSSRWTGLSIDQEHFHKRQRRKL